MTNYIKSALIIVVLALLGSACKTANVHLASDVTTGEYLGVVMTETRDFESNKILYYEIGNGETVFKKVPQEIKIYEP